MRSELATLRGTGVRWISVVVLIGLLGFELRTGLEYEAVS